MKMMMFNEPIKANVFKEVMALLALIVGVLGFMLASITLHEYCKRYRKTNDEYVLPVSEIAHSTAIDVNAVTYQMEIPRYRRPGSPKAPNV